MGTNGQEYQSMKDMLNKLRKYEKVQQKINESVVNALLPEELEDEKKKFKEAVSNNVEFGPFNRLDNDIEFSGVLVKEKISWFFSLSNADGCIITCENLSLSDENLKTLQKLSAYYTQWSQYWGNEMNN